jgi:hypothetical protein
MKTFLGSIDGFDGSINELIVHCPTGIDGVVAGSKVMLVPLLVTNPTIFVRLTPSDEIYLLQKRINALKKEIADIPVNSTLDSDN